MPSLAIQEHLISQGVSHRPHFLVSSRSLDANLLTKCGLAFTSLPIRPLPVQWWGVTRWPGFIHSWLSSVKLVRAMMRAEHVKAVVAMGGFVSAPAVTAAHRAGVPVVLVNLDAVPGKANRRMAGHATKIFSVHETSLGGQRIGLPLRQVAIGGLPPSAARRAMGLRPDRKTLLVVGGSQGADTINQMMVHLVSREDDFVSELRTWQVLHLAGDRGLRVFQSAYERVGVDACVERFCEHMADAWAGATLAISRAGAGSVAEVWANATPTVFMPYPHHKDQHQKHNAANLVGEGAAYLVEDQIDPAANAQQIAGPLLGLMRDAPRCAMMSRRLRETWAGNGAAAVAQWLGGLS